MKTTILSVAIAAVLVGGAIMLSGYEKNVNGDADQAGNNVSIVDGKQIIVIDAKGGYSPKATSAKAGMPTVVRVDTQGTFDCSSAISIPSLGYRNNLPPTGETLIEVPSQVAGGKIQGLCSMGMYSFTIHFN